MSTAKFELLLIEQVRSYPNLYDPNHRDYKDISKAQSDWQSIAHNLDQVGEVPVVKGKWRTLRDGYARARRKMHAGRGSARKYKYYHELAFLAEFIKHKDEEGRLSTAPVIRRRKKLKKEAIDFEILDEEELSSTGGLLVPDIILKEEEFNFSGAGIHSTFGAPSLSLDNAVSSCAFQSETSNSGKSSSQSSTDHQHRSPAPDPEHPNPSPLSDGLLEPLKAILWETQKHLDEDESFGVFVAASLRKHPHKAKSQAKLRIQQILHDLDTNDQLNLDLQSS